MPIIEDSFARATYKVLRDAVAGIWLRHAVLSALWRLDSCSFRHAKCAAGKAQILAGTMAADPMRAAREERRWIWR